MTIYERHNKEGKTCINKNNAVTLYPVTGFAHSVKHPAMKTKPNELFENLSGTIGGLTVTNRSGQLIVRKKTVPRNANTASQKVVRKNFSIYTRKWAELSNEQRNKWNQKACEVSAKPDRFGLSGKINGLNLYMKCNLNLSLLDTPTELYEPARELPKPTPYIERVSLTKSDIIVELSENVPADHTVIIRATPLNAGKSTDPNRLCQVGAIPGGGQTADITEKFRARFGELTSRKKVQVQVYAVHNKSGYASTRREALSDILP